MAVGRCNSILKYKDEATYIKAVASSRKQKEEIGSLFGSGKIK
jgi:hypothetical protein